MNRLIVMVGAVFLAVGSFTLLLGLGAYLFPNVRGHLHAGAGITAFGSLLISIGIISILAGFSKKDSNSSF